MFLLYLPYKCCCAMIKSREELKTYFETGDIPIEEQFADLIDTMVIPEELEGHVVDTTHIADGAVTTPKIAKEAVTDAKLAPLSVGESRIKGLAVTTAKIANKAVTTEKIAEKAVTVSRIVDGAVTTPKIADRAVTSDKIADGAVTNDKIGYGAVTNGKIASEAITIDKLELDLEAMVTDNVKYRKQNLTAEQKAQARKNIDVDYLTEDEVANLWDTTK